MTLNLLDEKVRSKLRSGVAITSMTQCVRELVENSIDAGANCIAIRVDISKYKVQVIDNGKGLSRQDLDLIGQRYFTSKCHTLADLEHNLQHLGYRGEALASIINCTGTVEICSRHCLSQQTYSKLFLHGRPMSLTSSSNPRPSVGTTLTMHDFFYNLPVRRNGISGVLEMENIRQTLQCLALVNSSISFSLRNDAVGECVLQTRKTNSILGSFSLLFGTYGMREVSLNLSNIGISGLISTETHHNKSLQFVYVNRRLVRKTALHHCVNNMIANSLIARSLPKQTESKWNSDITSPRKVTERHAVYVLMIKCSRSEYDICLEPSKTLIEFKDWGVVIDCLTQVVKQFLIQNSLTLGPECMGSETENSAAKDYCDSGLAPIKRRKDVVLQNSAFESCSSFHMEVRFNHVQLSDNDINEDQEDTGIDAMDGSRQTSYSKSECKEKYGNSVVCDSVPLQRQVHVPMLHTDKPIRSPLKSHGISSKLANLLQKKDLEKSSQFTMHSTGSDQDQTFADSNIEGNSLISARTKLEIQACSNDRGVISRDRFNPVKSQSHINASHSSARADVLVDRDIDIMAERCASMEDITDGGSVTQADYTSSFLQGFYHNEEYISNSSTGEDNYCLECHSRKYINFTSDTFSTLDGQNIRGTKPEDVSILHNELSTIHGTSELNGNSNGQNKPTLQSGDTSTVLHKAVEVIAGTRVNSDYTWKEGSNPLTNKKMFIHTKTGKSYSSKPSGHLISNDESGPLSTGSISSSKPITNDNFSMSYGAKPLNAAPHLSHDFQCFLPSTKRLRIDNIPANADNLEFSMSNGKITDSIVNANSSSFENLLKNWKNPAFIPEQEDIVSIGSKHRDRVKVHNIINWYKFSKEMLNSVKVIGQVDKKFIACILDVKRNGEHGLLVLFDQHAVHERVRLEALLDNLYESSSSGSQLSIKCSKIHPPLLISLTPAEKKLARLFQKQLGLLGVSLRFDCNGSVSVASLPSVLIEREVTEVRRGRPAVALRIVQDMIVKHLEVILRQ